MSYCYHRNSLLLLQLLPSFIPTSSPHYVFQGLLWRGTKTAPKAETSYRLSQDLRNGFWENALYWSLWELNLWKFIFLKKVTLSPVNMVLWEICRAKNDRKYWIPITWCPPITWNLSSFIFPDVLEVGPLLFHRIFTWCQFQNPSSVETLPRCPQLWNSPK